MIQARELAYFALISFENEHMEDFFNKAHLIDPKDLKLAKEIAYGTVRRFLTLEYWAKSLSTHGKLQLKRREKLLLYSALYQHVFLDRVPAFAINDETVGLAKKHFGQRCAQFFNALLRKVEGYSFSVPEEWENAYSYPKFFIESLLREYGKEKTKEMLDAMNLPPRFFARDRSKSKAVEIEEKAISSIAQDKNFYIQNRTPIELLSFLKGDFTPKSILDLCASPGGKLLHAHDLFPQSKLTANDVSKKKCDLLQENLMKYGVESEVTCGKGEEISFGEKFDLIIVDAPCSNSGVLHKRPEARWRLTQENLEELKKLQKKILLNAVRHLSPEGRIWYFTCSILKEENESVLEGLPLEIERLLTILPNKEGADGGFACSLKQKTF